MARQPQALVRQSADPGLVEGHSPRELAVATSPWNPRVTRQRLFLIGRSRTRMPVAAKMALATAARWAARTARRVHPDGASDWMNSARDPGRVRDADHLMIPEVALDHASLRRS